MVNLGAEMRLDLSMSSLLFAVMFLIQVLVLGGSVSAGTELGVAAMPLGEHVGFKIGLALVTGCAAPSQPNKFSMF